MTMNRTLTLTPQAIMRRRTFSQLVRCRAQLHAVYELYTAGEASQERVLEALARLHQVVKQLDHLDGADSVA